jgi:NAD(P)-dependent dehydrogenase (short-subunit alcohol dehydrogenase family)
VRELAGRTAVITGAASGIGFALARRCAREGMRVALGDVEEPALASAVESLRVDGAEVIGVPTDVADAGQVIDLRERAESAFGTVHLLCNNAGVLLPKRPLWELELDDWRWVVDVNLWGVVHGLHAFVPAMVASGEPCHVVNTASSAGVVSVDGQAAYSATKHAVVSISETLFLDMQSVGADVGVSVLCPGAVNTRIAMSGRNRQSAARDDDAELARQGVPDILARHGDAPEAIADMVVHAVRDRRFYIFARAAVMPSIADRARRMAQGLDPAVPAYLRAYDEPR